MLGELTALADARPRNLYLIGLFIADHQLPEPEALPAPPEPAAVPETLEPAALAAVPDAIHLPAPTDSIGALPVGTEANTLAVSYEHAAAVSVAVAPDQHAPICPSVPPPPPPLPPPASTADGTSAVLTSPAVPSLGASMAAAVAQQPSFAAAPQPRSGVAQPGATQSGPNGLLPGPPGLQNVPPPPAGSPPQVGEGSAPASAATEHVELAAAADRVRKASRWDGSDRSTPESGPGRASLQQVQPSSADRQTTRWGKEPTRWGKELPSPLKAKNNWKGRLVNNAPAGDTVYSVRPAQHGELTSEQSTPAPSPLAPQTLVEPTAGTPAQRAEVKLEYAAPSGDAAQPEGTVRTAAPAVGAEEDTRQAASGTAPEESQRSSDWEAALVSGKAPWRAAADAAAAEAEAASVSRTATNTASEETSKKPHRRSDPGRASRESRSRDKSRTRRASDRRADEPGQQPVEQRKAASRGRRSPGRGTDQGPERWRLTEGRHDDRKRPRLRSRSADRRKDRRGRGGIGDRLERDRRRGGSGDRQVHSSGWPDPSSSRRGPARWGRSMALRSDEAGLASGKHAVALPPPAGSMAPAASMANMLMLTTGVEERARLLASVLGQVQQSGKQGPAPHAAAVSEEGDDCELPPLPDSPGLSQGLPAQAEGGQEAVSAPECVATAAETVSHVQDVVGKANAAGTCTPTAEVSEAEPPLPPGAGTAATKEQASAPAAGDAALLTGSRSPHAPVMHAGTAPSGRAANQGQPVGADGVHQPVKMERANRRRRWDAIEAAGRHDDGGQTKRQREGPHSDAQAGTSAVEGPPSAQQQHSEAYQAACSLLEDGYNPLRTQAGLGPARQSYMAEMCVMGDKCPWPSDCDGAHVESELLTREQVTALCDLAREWRRDGVPTEWRHLDQRPSYDPFSRQSGSPPQQTASGEARPPSESPPPLPVDSACEGMPSPDYRLPPPSGEYTAWCVVKDEPPGPSYNPFGTPSPRSSAEGHEQPPNSLGIPYGAGPSPPAEPPPPPPLPISESPSHEEQSRPCHATLLRHTAGELEASHQSAVHVPSPSRPKSPVRSPSPAKWPQHGDFAKPPAQPDSPLRSPVSPASVQEASREQTPPPLPPPPELRDMPPLGSAQKAQQAAQTRTDAQAEPAGDAAAQNGEGETAPAASIYAATERARALLANGIDPLRWHIRADAPFVRNIRTRLCHVGNACPTRLTNCAHAHGPRELLTRGNNMLLVEVAREWQSHGVPAEWKHVVKRPTVSHEDPPAARTVVVALRRSKGVSPLPPPRRREDGDPKAPPAARSRPDARRHEGRRPAAARRQQLPHSMLNEDLEIEDSLMNLITVRLSWSTGTCILL